MNYSDKDIIHVPFLSSEECQQCIEYLKHKEKYLKTIDVDYEPPYKENNICTRLHSEYNFFLDNPQYIKRLEEFTSKFLGPKRPLAVQSWGNIYEKNQGIEWHHHNIIKDFWFAGYTANIFLGGDENIGLTYAIHCKNEPKYQYKHVKNKLGYIMMMRNNVYHMVKKNDSKSTRYTLGMTITENEDSLSNLSESESILWLNKQNEKRSYQYS
tara:strand:- start:228 stop:863 length:636 start_codon:yes stop_codon:yes gene_type:complete